MRAAHLLHQALLHNTMRSPQSFFDTTPSGRVLNRFSKDIHVIDQVLGPTILMLLSSFSICISTLVIIVVSTPLFTVVILPLAAFYIFVQVLRERVGVAVRRASAHVGGTIGGDAGRHPNQTQRLRSWVWLGTVVRSFPSLKLIFLTCKIGRILGLSVGQNEILVNCGWPQNPVLRAIFFNKILLTV